MIIPFSYLQKRKTVTVGSPVDGTLVVEPGTTVSIPEGSVKRYSNVIIRAGGVLRISGNIGSWTELGVTGNLICDGLLECRTGYDGETTPISGTFTKTSAFGLGSLSRSITQANGGAGAAGGNNTSSGGAQNAGRGGGGGGGDLNGGNGGAGGSNGSSGTYAGGTGGLLLNGASTSTYYGATGSSGGGGGSARRVVISNPFSNTSYTVTYYGGGGGGGGYRGHHGKGLVLYVEGTIGGTGIITCAGRNGFDGGSGCPDIWTYGYAGGSGGGGAGGSGGRLVIRYRDLGRKLSLSVAGGAGGLGGQGTIPGASGASGAAGVLDLIKII